MTQPPTPWSAPQPQSGPPQPQSGPPQPQSGQPQPQSGQPQPAGWPGPAGPVSAIALTTRYFPLAFLLAMTKPYVTVNGHVVAVGWGRTAIPVPPGQHQLHVHVPYLLPSQIGAADATVPVGPGQTVEVEYRAPVVAFSGGSLGPAPQKYNGMPVLIGLLAVMVVLGVCACVAPALTSLSGG